MREKPLYDRAIFWVALGGVAVVIGGILVAVGVAQVVPYPGTSLFGNGWFVVGLVAIGLGILLCLVGLVLFLAHQHAESHLLRDGVQGLVAQAPAPQHAEPSGPESPKPQPTPPKENIDLDLIGMQEGWANLTSAQEENFVDSNLRGKRARVSVQVADVWKTPPSVIAEINRKEPGPIQKTRLNVQLVFESSHAIMLLNKGDTVQIRGEVVLLGRNPYQVPHLLFRECELLKGSESLGL